ncbi:hypothetical protein W02_15200 [Nitrospira sp. KM1]|uniref:hypothetical protein n=1 Tax=Nitrospira sp. KM1 TaxID=1936990 RepID=UPI0013A77DF1|nr:hypothetical protein [Nitrospira sp. KM1]BCA54380.1 hypothetical protein W02_15200 [Nitrospira sp. KM1]
MKVLLHACFVMLSMAQYGCLATAWVAAVGADSTRTGHVWFAPFERTWVSNESMAIAPGPVLRRLSILPVDGDADMSSRFTQVISDHTTLTVIPCAKHVRESVLALDDEANRPTIAQNISREMAVDAVLFGRVTKLPSHPSDWGWRAEELRRLHLYLLDKEGHVLWMDELPFTVSVGSKPPIEQVIRAALARHFQDHAQAIGLDARGYMPKKPS